MSERIRVLVHEPDTACYDSLVRELSQATGEIEAKRAATVKTLRKRLQEEPWDIVLLSVGEDATKEFSECGRLRASHPDMPILVVAPKADYNLAVQAMKAGAQDCVSRDDRDRLATAIQREHNRSATGASLKAAAEQSEQRGHYLHQALDAAGIGTWELNYQTRHFRWDQRLAALFSMEGHHLERSCDTLLKYVHPEDVDMLKREFCERNSSASASGVDFRIIRGDGEVRWLTSFGRVVSGDDESSPIITGVMKDITERKISEERVRENEELFRAIVEDQTEMIMRWRPDGSLTFVNQAFCRQFHRDKDSLAGANFFDLIDEQSRALVQRKLENLTPANTVAKDVIQVRIPERSSRWHEWTDRAFFSATGQMIEIQSVGQDVTERRIMETHMRQSQKLEAIGTLAGGIAHDFNNILSGIQANADLIDMDLPADHIASEFVQEIIGACRRAADLVGQILTFSRHRENQQQPINVEPIVKEVIKFLRATLPAEIEIQYTFGDKHAKILADPTQIHQVIMNLTNNGWQALDDKPGRIAVELDTISLESGKGLGAGLDLVPGEYVSLSVKDNGRGMDPATRDRIFEPFFTTREPGQGTGLGLPVVHGIVTSHGGAVLVDSNPGQGSQFTVLIPALKEEEPFINEDDRFDLPRGQGERLLFVDDEEILASVGQRMLQRLGYEVHAETNPMQAWQRFARPGQHYDLVLTDLAMPECNGIELTRMIRNLNPETPIILMSGYFRDPKIQTYSDHGVSKVLMKPLDIKTLAESVHGLLTPQPK